jgi:hypothetical protein
LVRRVVQRSVLERMGDRRTQQAVGAALERNHLSRAPHPEIGHLRLDEINAEVVQKLRAKLVKEKELGDKPINNVMVVLSKSLRYAMDCELIDRVPKCRVKKIERAELEAWTFDEYPRSRSCKAARTVLVRGSVSRWRSRAADR